MSGFSKSSGHDTFPAPVVDQLLDLLGSDDAYRRRFQDDPTAALAEIGYAPSTPIERASTPTEGQALYCMTTRQLASKEEIQEARGELKSYLTTQANHIVVFAFESGQMDSVLRSK